ncbi:MAG: NAD(P)-dependent oxidoreductase [Phycisphaeraceae bacterium]
MKVTLTGAAGRLGSVFCRHLLDAGHDVRAVDRQFRNDLGTRLEMADVTDPLVAYRILEDAEALIHLASPSASRITLDTFGPALSMNMNLFQAAADLGVQKIVYASSIQAVCGRRRGDEVDQIPSCLSYLPLDGQEPTCPNGLYGLTKVMGEQQLAYTCRLHGIQGLALRFPYMATDRSMAYASRGSLDELSPRQLVDDAFTWLHVDDGGRLINAILLADLPGFRTYTPGTTCPRITASVDQIVARLYPDVELRQPISKLTSLVDSSRITRDTGWTPEVNLHAASSP